MANYQDQLSHVQRQLRNFNLGMRWKVSGVDRTDSHVATLKKMRDNIRRMIDLGYA